jgi:general secretion pathway protein D
MNTLACLSGWRNEFEVVLHALEENVAANMLSAPSILTLENQEATILVGEQFPIISTTKSSDTSTTVDVSLDEYKDIGIQLNVVPQVSGKEKEHINMIVHPAVTARGQLVERYPIISTREAQTQVLIKSGETIVIGGLIKDIKINGTTGVPFLNKLPLLGVFFRRETTDTEKVELSSSLPLLSLTRRIWRRQGANLEAAARITSGKNSRAWCW